VARSEAVILHPRAKNEAGVIMAEVTAAVETELTVEVTTAAEATAVVAMTVVAAAAMGRVHQDDGRHQLGETVPGPDRGHHHTAGVGTEKRDELRQHEPWHEQKQQQQSCVQSQKAWARASFSA